MLTNEHPLLTFYPDRSEPAKHESLGTRVRDPCYRTESLGFVQLPFNPSTKELYVQDQGVPRKFGTRQIKRQTKRQIKRQIK
jgi:hypothetical protein